MPQQDPESTRASSPWLIVLGFIALVIAVMLILRACPKPVPAGQPGADGAEQKNDREVAAG